ncbi:MAG: hypothetical protein CMJ84_15805 [Planctomycetes bacterium]|nr:hypothetical protein [Planctomycetota bacterium]MDP6410459.1 hypothetical protein [Planctomycetota bacterium]
MHAYSGQPLTGGTPEVMWKTDGAWNTLPMTQVSGDDYVAFIPPQVSGTLVQYFVHAEDGSGRSENHPYIGAGDPHAFLASPGTTYCFGDGSGTACPCGNAGGQGRGCASGASEVGAALLCEGSASVGADDLVLNANFAAPGQPGLFFQGDDAIAGGSGATFGDGLRCAGTNVVRLEVAMADSGGNASSSVPVAATGGVTAGDVERYQFWYRDPQQSPCGSGFNLTNGLELVWAP